MAPVNTRPTARVMRIATTCVLTLLLAPVLAAQVNVQDNREPGQKRNNASKTTTEDAPKNEVELYREEAKDRGEPIYGVCIVEECNEANKTNRGDFQTGKAIELPKPEYSAVARRTRASGEVRVQVIVDEDGKVVAAHALDGHPLLRATSVAAARKARFRPVMLNGTPIKVIGVIAYNFARN